MAWWCASGAATDGALTGGGHGLGAHCAYVGVRNMPGCICVGRTYSEDLGSSNGTAWTDRLWRRRVRSFLKGTGQGGLIALQFVEPATEGFERTPPPVAHGAEKQESAMARVRRLADTVATGLINVIIQGETGVGKEVLAKRIHDGSRRKDKPYLRINCAAFPESMVEAELFGYERGSFTGANQSKQGLLESATGGTVLLDEVAELPLGTQAKLLRAIGNNEVFRIGSLKPRPVDVRFLAATNEPIDGLIAAGRFRADLFYRLNGVTLYAPLRERLDEIDRKVAGRRRVRKDPPPELDAAWSGCGSALARHPPVAAVVRGAAVTGARSSQPPDGGWHAAGGSRHGS